MFNYRRNGEVFPLITPLFAPIYSKVIYCRTVPWKNVIHPFIQAGRAFSPFRYTSSSIFLLFSCALAKKINGSPYFLIEAGAGVSERKRMSRGALALSVLHSLCRSFIRAEQTTNHIEFLHGHPWLGQRNFCRRQQNTEQNQIIISLPFPPFRRERGILICCSIDKPLHRMQGWP